MVRKVLIAIATTIAVLALTNVATAQDLTTATDPLDLFKRPNTSEIVQACFAVLATYGSLFLIRVGTNILSEQVPPSLQVDY